jgi:hypothetical protein
MRCIKDCIEYMKQEANIKGQLVPTFLKIWRTCAAFLVDTVFQVQ